MNSYTSLLPPVSTPASEIVATVSPQTRKTAAFGDRWYKMNLERSLVLNRYHHSLFGAERFDELRRALKDQEEGAGLDGRSRLCSTRR